ncbi:hypothetical protein [Methylomonas koyamae]|uniref:hypothetical protein n=1 Tax=Methylomonas koyamae TaxID=702114 RepID=UPI0009EEBBA9|nr:hypothetical protein [Methylomonas koyamae]
MNAIDQSLNRLPCHTDWQRYDSPTVLRRHGRGFLERLWRPQSIGPDPQSLSQPELNSLVESFGGICLPAQDELLLLFGDGHWARRCQTQLHKLGIETVRFGCQVQLTGFSR